jgi:hypothetical protein
MTETNTAPVDTTEPAAEERPGGVGVSVLFWVCLAVAAGLYAAVALSPKLLAWRTVQVERYNNQVRLVTLEWQVKYLRRVASAFENDPQFAAEQARVDFDATRPGDVRIPVAPGLRLDSSDALPKFPRPDAELPWYAPLLEAVTVNAELRRGMLVAAALITVAAFTFLQDSAVPGYKAFCQGIVTTVDRATSRYRRSA